MKILVFAIMGIFMLAGVSWAADKPEFKTDNDKLNYSLGYQIGGNFAGGFIEVNPEMFAQGVRDAAAGAQPALSMDEVKAILGDLQQKLESAEQEALQEMGAQNLADGQAFLAQNAKKDGVVTLPSGLQYQIVKQGDGPSPDVNSTVTVHYRGTLLGGEEFDNSYKRGQPASFPVTGVIPGWTEALLLMKTGAQWKLFIPADLAYGPSPRGPIPPNSTLLFDVELLAVQ